MKRSTNIRALQIAFALSIALHLIVLPFVHVKEAHAAARQRPRRVWIVHVVSTPRPTPKPTPRTIPTHARPVLRARAIAIRPVRLLHHGGPATATHIARPTGPLTTGGPIDAPTGEMAGPVAPQTPTAPTRTPKPACSVPNIPAKTVRAVPPEMPQAASEQGLSGTTQVEVQLAASGAVLQTSIYRSSGSALLDQAALRAARESAYTPEQRACLPVSGSYLFTAEFDNNQ